VRDRSIQECVDAVGCASCDECVLRSGCRAYLNTLRLRFWQRSKKSGKPHVCREGATCTCNTQALEPDENCPVHGFGPYPPRCVECGRFMKRGEE
jgi:hypothetical protein